MMNVSGLTKTPNIITGISDVATKAGTGLADTINYGTTALSATLSTRLYFIDNLRILLAALVVMHHAGQPYGPGGYWLIPAEPTTALGTSILGAFFVVNMSFFMGLFFMISAYFVPGSYGHKGAGTFYKDRLVRLGVPVIVFMALVLPVMLYLLHGIGVTSFGDYYRNTYLTIGGLLEGQGFSLWHLWFLEQLLIFSGFYVLWRKVTGGRKEEAPRKKLAFPGNLTLAAFAIGMGLAMFAVRIIFPLNIWLPFVSFEPAHYPEYIAMFTAGILVYRNDWLNAITSRTAKLWGCITAVTILLLVPMFLTFHGSIISGGLAPQSLVLSLWEGIVCTGMSISLLYLFRTLFNTQSRFTKALSENSFTVYIVHVPIIVLLQYLLMGVNVHPLVKFAVVCLIGVPACFLLSHYVVRRMPLAKYVL